MLDFIPYGLGVAVALLTILELVFAPVLLLYFCWSVLRSLRRIADSMEPRVQKLYPVGEYELEIGKDGKVTGFSPIVPSAFGR